MASIEMKLDVEAVKSWLEKADMVAVVRCKDCKWYKTKFCKMDMWTDLVTVYVAKADDYCSYGKRREDETDLDACVSGGCDIGNDKCRGE